MTVAIFSALLGLFVLGWLRVRKRAKPDPTRVSEGWLRERERHEEKNQFEGVCWTWPVHKVADEAAQFNAAKLKRRA